MVTVRSLRTGIKYKETPIGKIPLDWELTKLNKIGILKGGNGFPERYQRQSDGKYCFIKVSDMNLEGNEIFIRSSKNTIDDEVKKKMGCTVFPKDTIVFAKVGAALLLNRRRILLQDCCIDNNMMGLIVNKEYNSKFYFYIMQSVDFGKFVSSGALPSINQNVLGNIDIVCPPVNEQNRIVEILTKVDAANEETDKIIEKSKELKRGLMQKLLTRGIGHKNFKKTEIGKIPVEWDVVNLKKIADVRYGLGQPPALDDDGIPMIRATNIHNGEISAAGVIRVKKEAIPSSRNPYLKEGDIIVVRSGAYTGDIGLISKKWERAVAGYDLVVSPSKKVDPMFLTNYLLSNHVQKGYFALLKERSAQPHLNSTQVEGTPIALPPLAEQHRIADILNFADMEIKKEYSQRTNLEALKKSLIQVLLTGKVRVQLRQ